MEQLNILQKIKDLLGKYKYVLLIIAVGIVLMMWPDNSSINDELQSESASIVQPDTEELLETILCKIKGAGRVEVMLTTARGSETIYQLDTDQSENQARHDTVIVTGADRAQSGLITQINPPLYQGAIVVCDGADDPTVRLNIVEAVSKATGLGASSISVLKMK